MEIKFINQENELIVKFECSEQSALLFMNSNTFSLSVGNFANIGSYFDFGRFSVTIVAKQITKE